MSIEDFSNAMRRRNSPTGDWRDGLAKTEAGTARKNLFNACVALRDHPDLAGKIAYDEFRGTTWTRDQLPWDRRANRPWTEFDDIKATEWLQAPEIGILVSSGIVREAVQAIAHENRFHPVLEWLESLEWDGTARLSAWLATYLGVPRTPLSDAFGRKALLASVARIQSPGCKADHMLILEGQQGIMKSRALHALVGEDWFADQIADLGTKDSCQDLRGVWIVELSELSAIRPGEVERIKAYISRQVDHYRPSYGRRSIDVPRQCTFIGTTNAHEYLSDATGGRRFWPVTCTKIDIDAITRDRNQIWAEAVSAYHSGEKWWLDDDAVRRLAEAEQELRRIEDPWEPIIAEWLGDPTQISHDGIRVPFPLEKGRVSTSLILEHAIAMPADRQSTAAQMRVGKVLKLLKWEKHKSDGRIVWEHEPGIPESRHNDNPDQRGIPDDEVSLTGVPEENQAKSHVADARDTRDTYRAHTCDPCSWNFKTEGAGVPEQPDGSARRDRIGSCAYCYDAAYSDDADRLTDSDGVLHYRCTTQWLKDHPA